MVIYLFILTNPMVIYRGYGMWKWHIRSISLFMPRGDSMCHKNSTIGDHNPYK
jgi:hypothetical protein